MLFETFASTTGGLDRLSHLSPKELEKVGVYGFLTDGITGDSVLANNPDLSTDAGQFAMIESIKTTDTTVEFEFIAAIPMEKDITIFEWYRTIKI